MRVEERLGVSDIPRREHANALVIFARYPEPGKVKTRLAKDIGDERAASLYRAFLCDLAERFTCASPDGRNGYDLYWACAPSPRSLAEVVGEAARCFTQQGDTLDERLYRACVAMRQAGYERVVIVGSDAPYLPANVVADALSCLGDVPVVLGPAEDGGYYLIGVCLQPEPPDLFRGIQMSTATVSEETLARVERLHLAVALLPTLFDIDTRDDLTRLAALLAVSASGYAAPHTARALAALGLDR